MIADMNSRAAASDRSMGLSNESADLLLEFKDHPTRSRLAKLWKGL
jgi:hypothetical protein